MSAAEDALFFGLTFTIIPSDSITPALERQLVAQLQDNGGTLIELASEGAFAADTLPQLSHIISTHADFPQYDQALDDNVHVVKPSWVDQSLVKRRIAQVRQHSPDSALIFQDVVVSFGDLPEGDKDAITAGVMALGGQYSSALTKLVTHVVSLTEDSDKIKMIRQRQLDMNVVLPHWFNDCLALGKKIGDGPYRLPDPEILDQRGFSARKVQHNPDIEGALSAVAGRPPRIDTPPPSSPTDPATPRKRLNVFAGKKVFFCRDLNIRSDLTQVFEDLTKKAGGIVTSAVEDAHVYIGHYRQGWEYVAASRDQKVVGNLVWFYYVILRNRWSKPMKKLLHYPVPRGGISGFEGAKISLSNYTGDARTYLENLIETAGGEYTKTMRQDNTHLITAHIRSEKCKAAEEWNIHIINHLWLEESYAQCTLQSLTNTRYTTFPTKTNLSEIVGRTEIDPVKVEELYCNEGDSQSTNPGAVKTGTARKSVKVNGDADVNGHQRHTPAAERHANGKENEAPASSKRASAVKAATSLQRAADDIALFEKEMKRKGGVLHGRKRGSDAVGGNDDEQSDDAAVAEKIARPAKKQKSSGAAVVVNPQQPVVHRMLLTGHDRWKDNPKKESTDRKLLRNLGVQVVTDPRQCNLLCAPRILRTKKFVMAIASAPRIVDPGYVDDALANATLPELDKHDLVDQETEAKWGIDLADSLVRAKENGHRLLRGWTIYATEHLTGGFETYKEIIEANGGQAVVYRGRTGVPLPHGRLTVAQDPGAGAESQNQGGDAETRFVYLISSPGVDARHWATFRAMADRQGLEARVVRTDWLLNLAMAQRVAWDGKWELLEGME